MADLVCLDDAIRHTSRTNLPVKPLRHRVGDRVETTRFVCDDGEQKGWSIRNQDAYSVYTFRIHQIFNQGQRRIWIAGLRRIIAWMRIARLDTGVDDHIGEIFRPWQTSGYFRCQQAFPFLCELLAAMQNALLFHWRNRSNQRITSLSSLMRLSDQL